MNLRRVLLLMTALAFTRTTVSGAERRQTVSERRQGALIATLTCWPGESVSTQITVPDNRRESLLSLCESLIREGGYHPDGVRSVLGIEDEQAARIARAFRQLDSVNRVKRSTAEGDSGRIDALVCGLVLAPVYTPPDTNGLRAAAHLAELCDDDLRADACARVLYYLSASLIANPRIDKRELLADAAGVAGHDEVARRIRAARTTEWRRFAPLENHPARLERLLKIWYTAESYEHAMKLAESHLPCPRSRHALACLLAAHAGPEGVPTEITCLAATTPAVERLQQGVVDLTRGGILLPVIDPSGQRVRVSHPPDTDRILAEPSPNQAIYTDGEDRLDPSADAFMRTLELEAVSCLADRGKAPRAVRSVSAGPADPFQMLLPSWKKEAPATPDSHTEPALPEEAEEPTSPDMPEPPSPIEMSPVQ